MEGFTGPKEFCFFRDSNVYQGKLVEWGLDTNRDSFRFGFYYDLVGQLSDSSNRKLIYVSTECYSKLRRGLEDLDIRVVKALDKMDDTSEEFLFATHNIDGFDPIDDVNPESASRILARHLKAIVAATGQTIINTRDLAVSTGFSAALALRGLEFLRLYSILSVSNNDSDQPSQCILADGGMPLLEKYLMSASRNDVLFDFDAAHNQYFSNYSLPEEYHSPLVFVCMPLRPEHRPEDFFQAVKSYLSETLNVQCLHIEEDVFNVPAMHKIACYIRDSDLVVAELTSANPNVMYELGIAHTMNKKCVLFFEEGGKPPFDVASISQASYNHDNLKDQLARFLDPHFKEPH